MRVTRSSSFQSQGSRRATIAVFSALLFCSPALSAPHKPAVPNQEALRVAVAKFYEAYTTRDEAAMLRLMPPKISRCPPPENIFDLMEERRPLKILSWKIKSITAEDVYGNLTWTVTCTGESYRATTGALVEVIQTEQEPGKKPSTGDLGQSWIFVEGTWYLYRIE